MSGRELDIVDVDEIMNGMATDAYFLRAEKILREKDVNPEVVADVGEDVDRWHVFSGLKDVAYMLEGQPVDLYSIPEGSFFRNEPVMRLEGNYLDFCRYETSILGFICKASGIATAAMEIRAAAGDVLALSFGTRRQHPSTAAMIERSALIGGLDGISHVAGGEVIDCEAGGTMPHALVICFQDQVRAWRAYNDVMGEDVPRIMLCDTYQDEKMESVMAAEALGEDLDGVRLDTTGSRRGDMRAIVEEVRWELDLRGYEDVDIFVSGGIGAEEVLDLVDVADGFGVGGYVANASPVDFSLDIVEVEGKPAAKRGEKSGRKTVVRDEGMDDRVVVAGESGKAGDMLEPVVLDGEIVMDISIDEARQKVEEGLSVVKDDVLGFFD